MCAASFDAAAGFGVEPVQGVLAVGAQLDLVAGLGGGVGQQAGGATHDDGRLAATRVQELLGPQRLDHFDLGGDAGAVQCDVLGTYTQDHRAAAYVGRDLIGGNLQGNAILRRDGTVGAGVDG